MRKKVLTLLAVATLSALPLLANATITVKNATDKYTATASAGNSPCSSSAPYRQGIIDPGTAKPIPPIALVLFCNGGCVARVFMNDSCAPSGEVGTVSVDANKNVTYVSSHVVNGFKLTQDGNTVTVTHQNMLERLLNFFA